MAHFYYPIIIVSLSIISKIVAQSDPLVTDELTSSTESTTVAPPSTITTVVPSTTMVPTTTKAKTTTKTTVTTSTTVTTRLRRTTTPSNDNITTLFYCDFDYDMCDFTVDPQFTEVQWMLWKGKSPGQYTGPEYDHSSGEGYYLLLDAAAKYFGKYGKTARILSPEIKIPSGFEPCFNLSLWYHAYGFHLGELTVSYKKPPYNSKEEWTDLFDTKGRGQITSWRQVYIPVVNVKVFKLAIKGMIGEGPQSNYAIDDLQIMAAMCPTTTTPKVTLRSDEVFYYQTTTNAPAPVAIEAWIIALIVILCVFAVIAVGVIIFIYFRQKKLKLLKERQDAEKVAQLRREISQYGVIKARLDRSISGRIEAISNQNDDLAENARPFDRPVLDRRFISSARPASRQQDEDAERSGAVFSIISNASGGNRSDAQRAEAVFDIISAADKNRASQPALTPRSKSAVARGVHNIEETTLTNPLAVKRLPPLAVPGSLSPAVSPAIPRKEEQEGSNVKAVRFAQQPALSKQSSGGKPSAEKMDWFGDD